MKVPFELNIGLYQGHPVASWNEESRLRYRADRIRATLTELVMCQTRRDNSGEEPTLVVQGLAHTTAQACELAYFIAQEFEQDCVAVFFPEESAIRRQGYLMGPRADKWGSFDPKYFVRF